MSAVLILSATIAAIIIAIYLHVKNVYSYWERRGVPYLKPTFPFGNFFRVVAQRASIIDVITDFYNSSDAPILGVYSTLSPSLVVRDPKIIQNVLIKDFSNFNTRGFVANSDVDPMAHNMFLQSGEEWKRSRSMLSPTFTSGKLKAMLDTIVECAKPLQNHLEQFAESGKTFEIRDIFARYATNVIASVAFGIEVDCIANPDSVFRFYGDKVFKPTISNVIRRTILFTNPKLAKLLRLRFADKDIGEFMIETVRQNLEYRETNNVVRKDFFQLLMQLRNTGSVSEDGDGDWATKVTTKEKLLSLEEMAAHGFLFFVAGFETSSTTMSFCIYELAKKPAAQRKAQAEIDQVLQKHDGKLTYEALSGMKYIGYCIDETLRLHTPFGVLPRICTQDYKMPDSNVIIEKGTRLSIPATALHNDKKYYNRPTEFIPERFEEKQIENKSFVEMPYLPFGDGPRNCIGMRLGKLQTKIAIVTILRKFNFELGAQHINKELNFNKQSVVKSVIGGINVRIQQR